MKKIAQSGTKSAAFKTPWHAVAPIMGPGACKAVQALGTKRWLSAEAPRFPLPGCDNRLCDCRYRHYEDRRGKGRRAMDRNEFPRPYAGPQRRELRGRRVSD
jgi:hypothetical protein